MATDLDRLRRFALGVALILIAYAAAGVELKSGASASFLGFPFVIRRPELLPLGLVLASAYSLIRFYYYGFMLSHSPQRHRKGLLHKLHGQGGHGTYKGSVVFGPALYSTTPLVHDRVAAEAQLNEVVEAFPKVWHIRPQGIIEPLQVAHDDGEPYTVWSAEITVPFICRLAALLQDLDYSAPIWLNILALAVAGLML